VAEKAFQGKAVDPVLARSHGKCVAGRGMMWLFNPGTTVLSNDPPMPNYLKMLERTCAYLDRVSLLAILWRPNA
jgi:hypothetical protein